MQILYNCAYSSLNKISFPESRGLRLSPSLCGFELASHLMQDMFQVLDYLYMSDWSLIKTVESR